MKKLGFRKEIVKKPKNRRLRKIVRNALIGTMALGLSACGDVNNYYLGPDNGKPTDTLNPGQDAGEKDATVSEDAKPACITGSKPVCGDQPIQKYLKVGEVLDVGDAHFKLEEVGNEGENGYYVILGVQDPNCETINKMKLYMSQTEAINLFGLFELTLEAAYIPEEIGATGPKGAMISVKAVCTGQEDVIENDTSECMPGTEFPTCENQVQIGGILDIGDTLNYGDITLRLEDIEKDSDKNYALLSLEDTCGRVLTKIKVKENSKFEFGGIELKIQVGQIGLGSDTGWATINMITDCFNPPSCSSLLESFIFNVIVDIGENFNMQNWVVTLDDLMVQDNKAYALISVDSNGATTAKLKIEEGTSKEVYINEKYLRIYANTISAGYVYGAKWAELTISNCIDY